MRVNVGSGDFPLDGFTNVDLRPPADIVADFMDLTLEGVQHVEMSHVLEHISWRETQRALAVVRSWLVDGGSIRVEVPDMEKILGWGTRAGWVHHIYGWQNHDGEYHRSGFTMDSLARELGAAGFRVEQTHAFLSGHPARAGFPCILADARR